VRGAVALAALALAIGSVRSPAPDEPPNEREVDRLVDEYLALDGKSAVGLRRQDEILARLELLPPLDEKESRKWRKEILKRWGKGPELEGKSGRHWLWEEEELGRYIVGGKTRGAKGLLVALHGGGAGSGDAESAHGWFAGPASSRKWLEIAPEVLAKTDRGWTDGGTEEFVIELVERALRTFDVDRDRVYLAGHSMGGFGSWTLGAHHADLFAGIAPSAGAPTPILSGGEVVDIAEGVVPSLRNVRVAVYQSDDDPRVPPGPNRKAVALLAEHAERYGGYSHEYWEVTGRGHDEPPGGVDKLLLKVDEFARDPRPAKVVWQPVLRWKRQFYWLWWDRPEPRALLVATLDREANTVTLELSHSADGVGVLLDDELLDLDREVVVVRDGVEAWRGLPQRSLAVILATGARGDPALTYEARVPAGG
jgi:pimeloyl-ACP methyl ester carboxylesterase